MLQPVDTVLTSVGLPIPIELMNRHKARLEARGVAASIRPTYDWGDAWGADAAASRLLGLLFDETVRSVVAYPSEYGALRLVSALKRAPRKTVCTVMTSGSGCSLLVALLAQQGFELIYVAARDGRYDEAMFGASPGCVVHPIRLADRVLRSGSATGRLIGGDLGELAGLVGTDLDPFGEPFILFAQYQSTNVSAISRNLWQIVQRGRQHVGAIILDAPQFAEEELAVFEEAVTAFDVPVAYNCSGGLAFQFGTSVRIEF